jgi:hypothetical protein
MNRALTDGEKGILAEQNREAREGACPVCGEFFRVEEWYALLPDECLETEGGSLVPLAKCCPDCVDGFFVDDTCAHVTADGSYGLA